MLPVFWQLVCPDCGNYHLHEVTLPVDIETEKCCANRVVLHNGKNSENLNADAGTEWLTHAPIATITDNVGCPLRCLRHICFEKNWKTIALKNQIVIVLFVTKTGC